MVDYSTMSTKIDYQQQVKKYQIDTRLYWQNIM